MECSDCGYKFTKIEEGDSFFGWECPYCNNFLCGDCLNEWEEAKGMDAPCEKCGKQQ